MRYWGRACFCACFALLTASAAVAQQPAPGRAGPEARRAAAPPLSTGPAGARPGARRAAFAARSEEQPPAAADRGEGLAPLPPDRTTQHTITIAGKPLSFSATAGVIRLSNAATGDPLADVAYIAFVKNGADPRTRPVVFVFNGGPGYASGWLDLGGLGPWRLPMSGGADVPSAPPITVDNAQTWLDFADLVFIDPPGTGYSRVLGGQEARGALWSVDGDVDALATTIRRWVEQNNRMESPKFIAGESYGGFRAPKIAHALQTDQGVGVSGLILISPALDLSHFDEPPTPMSFVASLPSMTAVARETKGPITRADLSDVEQYAQGPYLSDLLKGPNDAAALQRMTAKVAAFTGLDPALVKRYGARVPTRVFLRAFWRPEGKIGSQYDGTVAGYDPNPFAQRSSAEDQLRLGLQAPIVQAMVGVYHDKLDWTAPRGRYLFFNEQADRDWNWGRSPQAISDLRSDLALDPRLRVLIAQGLTDLVVPYFGTQMLINQIPNYGPPGRLQMRVYPGGHMVYVRDGSRQSLHDDASRLVAAATRADN